MGFALWESARTCTGAPAPGAVAFMAWFTENYGKRGGYNLGIYNCRTVRGGATTSMHGEGRACDLGFPVGDPDGDALLRVLIANAGKLGIQAIIYERRIYSAKSPEGRPYTGIAPHYDHLHVEFSREAARNLNLKTIRSILDMKVVKPGRRNLHVGSEGTDVKWLQAKLNVTADGYFGPKTEAAVKRWERLHVKQFPRLKVDGFVGRLTWKTLQVNPTY